MKKGISSKKRIILLFCLIVGVILAATGGSFAIYTSQVYQRSVVRNRDNDVIRFSSDRLYRVQNGTTVAQKYYYPLSSEQRTMTFQVCNYDQAKNTLFNEKDIDYNITFQVNNGTDGFSYTVSNGSTTKTVVTEGSVSFTDNLRKGKRSTNSYSFTFGEDDYNKVELLVKVTPSDLSTTQNRILNGNLIPVEYTAVQGVAVKSEFTDAARGFGPEAFDAYNLMVSISGGSGDVLITWDHTMLDIDYFFASDKTITKYENHSTISVPMNSDDTTGTYLIQFYNHNTQKPDWTSWSQLPVSVKLKDTQGD